MCGIAGIVSLGEDSIPPLSVKKMCDRIAHRGPDDAGYTFFQPGAPAIPAKTVTGAVLSTLSSAYAMSIFLFSEGATATTNRRSINTSLLSDTGALAS